MEDNAVFSPEGDGAAGNNENPLLLEDIVEKVLGYLDFDNLKQCRLVNPLWNLVAGKLLSPKCHSIDFWGPNLQCSKSKKITDMSQLVNLLNSSWNFPCKKFGMDCQITTTPAKEEIVSSFFQLVGPWVTELKIVDTGDENQPLFTQPRHLDVQYMCLESLTVKIKTVETLLANVQSNLQFLGSILDHAPNLQCFHLRALDDPVIFTAAITLLEHVNCVQIREFSLYGDMGDEHLNRIVDLGMVKLKKLRIVTTENATVNPESLQNFLRSQSQSLETLHLESFNFKRRIIVELPGLLKLKELTLEGFYQDDALVMDPSTGMYFSGICYQRQFPQLQKLSFVDEVTKNLEEFLNDGIHPVETLTQLEFPDILDNPDMIGKAARIFPKLKKLILPSHICVVCAAYRAFGSVEELTVVYDEEIHSDSIDSILTRYFEEECDKARNNPEIMTEMIIKNIAPLPFLNKLRILKIVQQFGESGMSDLSCRGTLLKLEALKCLKLVGTFSQITEPVMLEMKDKFKVEFGE